ALNDGEIDLNAFQHYAYFNDEVSNKGYDLTAIADTYISAMNIYSTNITDVKENIDYMFIIKKRDYKETDEKEPNDKISAAQ
ncbi:MetQ/NlpA family ABC transporter substrate-binding protein, partial [Brachyspira hyodysenteriae]|uniref:MetQ/NlpA family ABC transporter substrate-binding protein n=1 Tax=Brachyspira hyodysenteriae TaxID=159 RepID=UPI001F5385EC